MTLTRIKSLERRFTKLARNKPDERVARLLARYANAPARYVREHLKRGLTPKQEEILELLDKPPYRVLARSANTQGKTFVAASKCSHFFDTARPSITLATAPTYDQVRDLLFRELRTLRPSTAGFLPKDCRLQFSPDHFVHGLSTNHPDRFQGRHAERLGLLFDEATGIDPAFWGRAETMFESHGGHWWLAAYNPNDSSSPAFEKEESGGWHLVVLNALEHPNIAAELAGQPPLIPAAVRLETILRRLSTDCERVHDPNPAADFEFPKGSGLFWHPNTPDFEAQILGRWPISPATALWSPFLFERCSQYKPDLNPQWELVIGCDCARFGDDKTVICVRLGPAVVQLEAHAGVNTTWISNRLKVVASEWAERLNGGRNVTAPTAVTATDVPVYIDDTGGYGAGVIDQREAYNFVGLNMSCESPTPQYPNNRSFIWCHLATLAQAGAAGFGWLPEAERKVLRAELTGVRYVIDGRGRRAVEPKRQIKERLGRSPDHADALGLAFYGAGV